VENVKHISEIEHPAVRAVLNFMKIKKGVEIHHDGDLPARTGLGSSSAFAVGLLHSMYALKGVMPDKLRLAKEAIHIERDILNENIGSQDQVLAAFGGFNKITFNGNDEINLQPILMGQQRQQQLQDHLILIFTGFSRLASEVAGAQIKNTPKKKKELTAMRQMVDEAVKILADGKNLLDFGKLLHENWKLKRSLTDRISTPQIDMIYDTARKAGAIGGKLLGAGGGGFMIFFARSEDQPKIMQRMKGLLKVPFQFENAGSEIIFHRPYA
jgi:D-glycero-alpha-D-manno-heptose-7-phosphate kinase